tara:strand:- start:6759 stop:7427 length:669 start_codon:yes stop_codon:yes gene_type:complete
MILSILQPTFIPDLQDLATIMASDLVVLQDTESWSRKSRVHRAKIRTPEGTQYINIPIRTDDRKNSIDQVRIDHTVIWIPQILKSLEYNYSNSLYYDFYEPEIRSDLESAKEYEFLLPFVLMFRNRVFRFLEVDFNAEFVFASELDQYDSDPDLLFKNLNASQYFQEGGSRHYQRQGLLKSELDFDHPTYRQHYDGFEEDCCLLDLLFQYGPENFQIVDKIQ